MASLLRSTKAACKIQCILHVPHRCKWVYSKKEGVPRYVMEWLQMDIDLSNKNIAFTLNKYRWKFLKEDHKYIADRHKILGSELAAAHFMVKRGAKVRFVGRDNWFKKDEQGNTYLPNRFVPGMLLEAIDASGMEMSYVAFDNMVQLQGLRYLNFSGCQNFNDWCMARLYQFEDTLEFLDISGCKEVTENGLACAHHLKNLRGLKLSALPSVKNMGLMVVLLEEMLPECTVFGVEPEVLLPPTDAGGVLPERLHALASEASSTEAGSKEDNNVLRSDTRV